MTDVLIGRATEKVVACGHDRLSTFGLLKEESAAAVRGYIEQLVGDGLLARDGDPYPGAAPDDGRRVAAPRQRHCALTGKAQPPGEETPRRRVPRCVRASRRSVLFDVLRDVRLRLARERGVPPYVIFHDTTLRDMVERRPKTLDDLHEVYGVGAKKAADFGDAFLAMRDPPAGSGSRTNESRSLQWTVYGSCSANGAISMSKWSPSSVTIW